MDVFNKLYSSVSSTVSQLSGVLPGNPVTREYEVERQIATAGRGLIWKIYSGFKKSTKQEASIFVMEKRMLERWSKDDRESLIETLRKSILQLTKIRHPQVLIVQHPLEESRESLAFATEPVFASLANILGDTSNMTDTSHLINYKLYDVEIKYGLMQLAEGIGFLHSEVKLLHRNITPESIVVNKLGAWKIFGFDFCVLNQPTSDGKPYWPLCEYNSSWHVLTQPCLEYMAPEYALISSHSPASDIYSLGVLIFTIYSGGKPIKMFGKDFNCYKRFANELKQGRYPNLTTIPEQLREYVKLMLNTTPEMRPNVHEFTKLQFFDDVELKTLSYLDSLFQWDNLQKSKFFKGLPLIIVNLPPRINMYRVLPCLVNEFVNPMMVPFILNNVLLIAEGSTSSEYMKNIWVHLKPVMKMQEPVQILLIFMKKMDLIFKLTPAEEVKSDVLPMLYRALESDAQQIQELCLSILPTFASLIDYPAMKNALLPRIKKLCLSTGLISVRVNCLLCIGKLLDSLDKWLVLDDILPFLSQISCKEPAVIMAILGIYKLALNHNKLGITKEVMATKIIPFLVPMSIENGLTLSQFNSIMALVKDMLHKVETEHRTKIEQLNSIKNESRQLDMNFPSVKSPSNEINTTFSNLSLDNYLESAFEETSASPGAVASSSNLSLSDKQRFVAQQEMGHRMQAQSPIAPVVASVKQPTKPLDLTSTLIESNLKQMKSPTMPSAWQQTTNAGGWGNYNFQSPPVWQQSQMSKVKPTTNLQSLNSILPQKERIPMNQMQTTTQMNNAVSNNNLNNGNQHTKALSQDDIMDLLS